MLLIPLVLAPAVMAVATVIERRLGPSAGGWVGALPVAFAVAVLAVTLDAGPETAASMALSAAVHVPAQVALGLVFAHVLARRGLIRGAVCGAVTYLVCSLLVGQAPTVLAVAVAVAALWFAPRLMPGGRLRRGSPRHWSATALTCLSAVVIVAAAVLSSRLAGPGLAGALAAFPTMCTMLTVVAVLRDGPLAGVHTLAGLVRSLPCYLAFCLVVAVAAPAFGLPAIGFGLLACLAAASVTWRRVPIAAVTARDVR
ncbi:hypothetical protein [Actinoplanes sp. NPDC049118]|uniref:hypothetical protein n=1 Tax=Actinoplanes sp. NPDC049118 TaxID=3155769 RepID=UPI0033F5E72F